MKSRPPILIVATVASHLRCFHLPWVKRLQDYGYRVVGAASDIETCAHCRSAFDEIVAVPFSRRALSGAQIFRAGSVLNQVCDRINPRLVHFHTPNAAFWGRAALAARVRGKKPKIVYTCHGFHFHSGGNRLKNHLFRTAESRMARFTDALLTINDEDFKAASAFQLAPGGFVVQISGVGVDLERFNPEHLCRLDIRSRLSAELKLAIPTPLVLMVAEFSPGKRHRDLLAAMKLCKNRFFQVLFAGGGLGMKAELRRAHALGLHDRVQFMGFRDDIPQVLAAADLVVLPSEREGLPTCIMEALAMNKAVIGANARGTRDLLAEDCGLIHEVGDVTTLANHIDQVLSDPAMAMKLAARGRAKIVKQYGWLHVQEELEKIYRQLGIELTPF